MRILLGLSLILYALGCPAQGDYLPRDGDLVFQTSRSRQSRAIQLATGSPYSHMGIVHLRRGKPFVFEAVQPVRSTPLSAWIDRGEGGHVVVKRLREADTLLTPAVRRKMWAVGESFAGRGYDRYFEWSDERLYCSELVWKIYARGAGIRLGERQRFAEVDRSHPLVAARIRERFGDSPPLDEMVISPAAMFQAPELVTVYSR